MGDATAAPQHTEQGAVEVLANYGCYLWHSGGGVMCARIDVPIIGEPNKGGDETPYVLIPF